MQLLMAAFLFNVYSSMDTHSKTLSTAQVELSSSLNLMSLFYILLLHHVFHVGGCHDKSCCCLTEDGLDFHY